MVNKKVGYVTAGVFVPTPRELELRKKNEAVFRSLNFNDACNSAGIPPTKRQAVKFKNGRGLAFMFAG